MKSDIKQKEKKVRVIKYSVASILAALAFSLAGRIFLRNFYGLISFEPQFSDIFRQINTAKMHSPIALLLISFAVCLFVFLELWKKKRAVKILAVIFAVVALLVLFFVSVWFTEVNDIMFGDVVVSLLPLLESGAI